MILINQQIRIIYLDNAHWRVVHLKNVQSSAFIRWPGQSQGLLYIIQKPPSLIYSSIESSFVKITLQRRHAKLVGDGAFSHKTDQLRKLLEILNKKGLKNQIIGSKIVAIFLGNLWVLSIGGVASGRVCVCSLRSRLVNSHGVPGVDRSVLHLRD